MRGLAWRERVEGVRMVAYVPVRWVAPVLYGVVLVGGLYSAAAGLGDGPGVVGWRTAGFVGAVGALFGLEAVASRRTGPSRPSPSSRAAVLAARCVLIGAVVVLDSSGLSQVLFVLVPFTAYFAFGRGVALALGALCVAGLLTAYVLTAPGWYREQERVADLLMLSVGLVLAVSMAAVAVGEQRARIEVEAYAARVAELSAATERNRLARDIHDSLGHHLTAMSVQLEMAAEFQSLDPDAARRALEEARGSVRLALADVRQSVRALRDEATRPSLAAALAGLARDGTAARPRVRVEVSGDEGAYGGAELTTLYRAAQEAVTNARRHAEASEVVVVVRLDGGAARLEVIDDGRGFVPDSASGGVGLVGMRERVQLVAGSVDVESGPGAGTRVTVTVPRGTPSDTGGEAVA
ncbi:sensor histidine kinase [Streptomyces sp. S.PB5]|uniref:sensor histidine kinase n=1 Tax=Streptomyces sp. S.PB5 TaxID=3020844 RepID=UPI0025B256D3|nr:sensor histidine kinase [Streptomyces sp. S.PB5]MDN3023540.1 sensor histidine kinase [Streptomyces sp. S.PB5]